MSNPNSPMSPSNAESELSNSPAIGRAGRFGWWLVARLRFVAILIAIGALIVYWDTFKAYYDKWTRPTTSQTVAEPGLEWFCPMHPQIIRDHPDKCPICFMPLSK